MKKRFPLLLAAVLLTLGVLAGCGNIVVTGSGNLIAETYNISDFAKVEAHNGCQVELTESSAFSVEVTVDDNVKEYLEVDKSGDTLIIRLKGAHIYTSVTLRAEIGMPELHKIDLSGGSRASITGFSSSNDFSAELSGGSRVSGDITAADADFDLSGGSQVDMTGSADDIIIDGSGGSQLDLEQFPVDNADIKLSGGGRPPSIRTARCMLTSAAAQRSFMSATPA